MRQSLFTYRCKVTDGRRYSSVGENGCVHRFSDREICCASLANDIESVDVRKLKRSRWSYVEGCTSNAGTSILVRGREASSDNSGWVEVFFQTDGAGSGIDRNDIQNVKGSCNRDRFPRAASGARNKQSDVNGNLNVGRKSSGLRQRRNRRHY